MTVKGDLEACLFSNYGVESRSGNEMLKTIFDCLNDPNFALAYAKYEDPEQGEEDKNESMCNYWSVVQFLRTLV